MQVPIILLDLTTFTELSSQYQNTHRDEGCYKTVHDDASGRRDCCRSKYETLVDHLEKYVLLINLFVVRNEKSLQTSPIHLRAEFMLVLTFFGDGHFIWPTWAYDE